MDIKLLNHAKEYIDKMANGINPLTNEAIPQNELLNNVHISRCLFYVSNVLENAMKSEKRKNSKNKLAFYINNTELRKFEYSEETISMSEIVKRINNLINKEEMNSLSVTKVHDWLISINILFEETINGKKFKRPTSLGNDIGISVDHRTNLQGIPYKINIYNKKAQEFIIDNFENLLEFINTNKNE